MKKQNKWVLNIGLTAMLLPAVLYVGGEKVNAQTGKNNSVQTASANQAIKQVTVSVNSLNIRKSNQFSSAVVGYAKKNQTYPVLNESNGLYQIGENQWITANAKYVKVSSGNGTSPASTSVSSTTQTVVITAGSLNVRTSASFSSPVAGVVKKNQAFAILESKNGLYRIGQNRWISANSQYVSVTNGQGKIAQPKEQTESVKSTPNPAPVTTSSVASVAKRYVGTPYAWGGKSPSGFDCSGFVYYVYQQAGKHTGYMNTAGLWNKATKVSSPQAGDLVFLQNTYKSGVSHVGIYLGNGQMIHAGSKGVEIVSLSTSYYKNHFLGYGRL